MKVVEYCPRKGQIQSSSWQNQLRELVRDVQQLCALLDLDPKQLPISQQAQQDFALRVPHAFVARMRKGDADDVLLKQVLPIKAELADSPGYIQDPLAEQAQNPRPGLLHKYQGRVLLTLTSSCAINCRFCFRRHFPYQDNRPSRAGWEQALGYITTHTDIEEVILSGGDPLLADNAYLRDFFARLSKIPHLKRCRIHSRLPIVLPDRLDAEFVQLLAEQSLDMVLVSHCNHAQELDHSVARVYHPLRSLPNVTLLNQSVLLAGINDNAECQIVLAKQLFALGILPYYLHIPDKVAGTAHFDLCAPDVQSIYQQMLSNLPGYLVPKLVQEQAHAPYKIPLSPNFCNNGESFT